MHLGQAVARAVVDGVVAAAERIAGCEPGADPGPVATVGEAFAAGGCPTAATAAETYGLRSSNGVQPEVLKVVESPGMGMGRDFTGFVLV